jgi:hypothetical protein
VIRPRRCRTGQSLQSALAHHGLIPEHVPVVTSVTTGRPQRRENAFGSFQYRHLSDRSWPSPNLVLLNNALAQTGWRKPPLLETSWAAAVRARLRSVRWETLAADVRPLLESAEDRALLTRETVASLLDQRSRQLPAPAARPKGRRRSTRDH